MKKAYKKPTIVAIALDLDEHITAGSGVPAGQCGWNWSGSTAQTCQTSGWGSYEGQN